MSLVAVIPLLAYLSVAAACDLHRGRIPHWWSALAFAGAGIVAALPDGRGAWGVTAGAATAAAVLAGPTVLGVVTRGDLGLATVAGAWLGPGLALQGIGLACATILLATIGLVAARSPRLLLQLPHALGPLTAPARAHVALPCTLPLAAGFAATALLAARG
ncbi:MAG TPA: hypothetical protein VGR62_01920 [Candidatus Binatia bacterium]|jgi:Flp pilus assembly protein protease CpaA|nr:hypothetical protein [Candidatus Binatia bacterium]